MQIVKKNLFSISCGVVALLAFIAWFWPVGSMYGSFQEDLKKRAAVASTISTLSAQKRVFPPLDGTGASKPLVHFPNKPTIDEVNRAIGDLSKQAQHALAYVVDLNQRGHRLLEPGSLPAPLDSQMYHFRAQYGAVMDSGGKPDPWDHLRPQDGPFNLPDQVLNSTQLATDTEINSEKQKKWASDYQPKVYLVNGQEVNRSQVEDQFNRDTANFVKEFHEDRASHFKIYCEKTAMTRAPKLEPNGTPSAMDIWFAQMTLWIEQDVCDAISKANKDVVLEKGQGIQMSPVKNLIEITIKPDKQMYVVGQANVGTGGPGAAPPPELDPSFRRFDLSPTGRVCNSLYDVVTFRVSLVVDARHLEQFLELLRDHRLLTVTQMSVQDVDWKAATDSGYVYGAARCLQVSLDCEELFMRDWTVHQIVPDPNHPAPMPAAVQALLGIPPDTSGPGQVPAKVAMQ